MANGRTMLLPCLLSSGQEEVISLPIVKKLFNKAATTSAWAVVVTAPTNSPVVLSCSKTTHVSGKNAFFFVLCFISPLLLCLSLKSNHNRFCFAGSHARLVECFESAGGNAAAATFVVVSSTIRRNGFGSQLMALLEDQAKQLGYHYVYLWTKTAIPFYRKIGYVECQRVSLKRACLQSLDSHQVEGLEAILLSKKKKSDNMTTTTTTTKTNTTVSMTAASRRKETILLPPGDDENDDKHSLPDVWMRKRLVEQVGSIRISFEDRIQELYSFLSDSIDSNGRGYWDWRYQFRSLPWQAQIGPSCGLAALRMVRDYFLSLDDNDNDEHKQPPKLPSLLGEAQERGYTQDGEIFDAKNLLELAKEFCGLEEANFCAEMMDSNRLKPQDVYQILAAGGVLILPYDSNSRTRFPTKLDGRSAHYGIVVGLLVGEALRAGEEENIELKGKSKSMLLHELADPRNGVWNDDKHEIILLVQHSLSSKWSIAPWSDFLESNQQLERVDSEKFGGDIRLDLKNRTIVFRRQFSA